jgi:hypothetical protein
LNNPTYDESGTSIYRQVNAPFNVGETVTVTVDLGTDRSPSAQLIGYVGGDDKYHNYTPVDAELSHTFVGDETRVEWSANYTEGGTDPHTLTVECVAAQAPPTTTTTTTIPEVETDIADSGPAGAIAAGLMVLGLLALAVATVRSHRTNH